MRQWCKILLIGIILGNAALLIDRFIIDILNVIIIPILVVALILILAGFVMRKKQLTAEEKRLDTDLWIIAENTPACLKIAITRDEWTNR